MLSHIYVKNFGLIREIDTDLSEGLNIISGETGTGKSMVIQAIHVALGGRGSSSMITDGESKALVQLVFTLRDSEKASFERYMSAEEDREIILTRELSRSGRSLARINGEIVKVSELLEASQKLADIHGQYDNQFFLDPERHVEILDSFAGKELFPVKEALRKAYKIYIEKRSALTRLRRDRSEYLRERDYMRYDLDEINSCKIREGEDDELEERIRVLTNAEKIYEALNQSYEILYRSDIDKCAALLSGIAEFSDRYAQLGREIENCAYTLSDLQEELRAARDQSDITPGELDEAMARLHVLDNLKRKYGGSLKSVLEHRDQCEKKLALTEDSEALDQQLSEEYLQAGNEVIRLSAELSEKRKTAASVLEKTMKTELEELNFSNAAFHVQFTEKRNQKAQLQLSANGTDQVEFLFSANKGASLRPLAEIASGGEISRVSLAFKGITSDHDNIGTMVFDEIDTGISGRTASIVAAKMHMIARSHQILCITHLPQIAAAGDSQYLINKTEDDSASYTTISPLDHEGRVEEIARLLGGTNITDTTRKSAEELLAASQGRTEE